MTTNEPKIGEAHAAAMFRLGLRELRAAFYPESNIAQSPAEYGIYGTATPGEVAEARRGESPGIQQDSVLGERLRQAEARDVHGREAREMDRG